MIGALASIKAPGMFGDLVLMAPSPRYIDDRDYFGGFSPEQMEDQLRSLESDFVGWSYKMAPLIMGNADRPELGRQLAQGFIRSDPDIAKEAARTFFTYNWRKDLPRVTTRSLVMQCRDDILAPTAVGRYIDRQLPNGELIFMRARGHYPHLSAPDDTVAAIRDFVVASRVVAAPRAWPEDGEIPVQSALVRAHEERRRSARTLEERKLLEDSLLRRAGGLRMHLGRYDMYAVSFQRLFVGPPPHDVTRTGLTIRTRGQAIMHLMEERGISREFIRQFETIEAELRSVLVRQEISSSNGATLTALHIASSEPPRPVPVIQRDWHDHDNATDDELRVFGGTMDQDILKVVSLYVRLANCAVAIERAARH